MFEVINEAIIEIKQSSYFGIVFAIIIGILLFIVGISRLVKGDLKGFIFSVLPILGATGFVYLMIYR